MKQEGGHIDFYASEAGRRLAESPRAQKLTRFFLKHTWRPVGSGVMPKKEVDFLVDYLFDGPDGQAALVGQISMRRLGEPADIARAVWFLLSDDASFITGTMLSVDGGWLVQ